jgi:CubicO group peptidase (beta-lactamase class C family)
MGYENIPAMQKAAAMAIAGVAPVTAKLPVSTNAFPIGSGIALKPQQYSFELLEEKFSAEKFKTIDSIALMGIRQKAYPGCQIVALQNGKIIYQKSFGKYTYDKDAKVVDNGTMYDLASLTKILSSALALMKLNSEGKFDYHKKIKDYLPEFAGSDKGEIVIEELLAHQAGLPAWIPFYQTTIEKNKGPKSTYYSKFRSEQFPLQVAHDLYAIKGIRDTLMKQILACKLKEPGTYLYSDLGYYFMQQLVEKITGVSLEVYVKNMYTKTGINLAYQPLNYFSKLQIAPTENDLKFRQQLIQGYVHDPGAAMMGGVAGHAGLFGSALDVAKLMQLYLNKGELNAQRIIDSTVVNDFTSCHFCPSNRRGLCFEKPEPNPTKESPVAQECSLESFGHSGFTGTFAWADPANKLVIVFLSNRVYPSAEDNKLVKLGTRTKIQKAFYEALK